MLHILVALFLSPSFLALRQDIKLLVSTTTLLSLSVSFAVTILL